MKKTALINILIGLLASGAAQAVVMQNTDFIADGTRTHFNGFEYIPNDGTFFTGGHGPYSEGGITVEQVNGDGGNDIWVAYNPSGTQGAFAWYPNIGDYGYTKITLSDGSDFSDVGFFVGTGSGVASLVVFEVYNNSALVLAGTSLLGTQYLGFSGGGFDTILVRDDHSGSSANVGDGSLQALTIDSIETGGNSVPEPASLALLCAGFLGLAASRKRKK